MCRKKEEGSETKQEVIYMSAWRQWVAQLNNAIVLGLFNFPLIFQALVNYWVGRLKGTFKNYPRSAFRMKGGNPEIDASSPGKEIFAAWTQWFPCNLTHDQHNASLSFQMHLPLAGHTCYCKSDCLISPGSSASCKETSLPSQGPPENLHSCLLCPTVLGILPRIVSITLSSFMTCICKLFCLTFIFMVLLLNRWAFVWD